MLGNFVFCRSWVLSINIRYFLIPRIAYPKLNIIHHEPEIMKGQAIRETPYHFSLWLPDNVSVGELFSESDLLKIHTSSNVSSLSSGKNGFTKNVAAKNPAPISECKASKRKKYIYLCI